MFAQPVRTYREVYRVYFRTHAQIEKCTRSIDAWLCARMTRHVGSWLKLLKQAQCLLVAVDSRVVSSLPFL